MRRIHLVEIEDLSWCPKIIRETTTDFLYGLYNFFDLYQPAYEKIVDVLKKTHTNNIVDCCSGSGGPIPKLLDYLATTEKSAVTVTLTDKYPNTLSYEKLERRYPMHIKGNVTPIDARLFPKNLTGMRTFFSSFHHFAPQHAQKILQDAVDNNAPIGIFECTERTPLNFLRTLFSFVPLLLILPMTKRLTWKKFLFTYLIPITPFTFMWDYFVSNLRTYSTAELQELINKLDAPGYVWEMGHLLSKKSQSKIPYLIGYKA